MRRGGLSDPLADFDSRGMSDYYGKHERVLFQFYILLVLFL